MERKCFLLPYSPDLNPAEGVFGPVKSLLKQNHDLFQVCEGPRAYLTLAFGMVTLRGLLWSHYKLWIFITMTIVITTQSFMSLCINLISS